MAKPQISYIVALGAFLCCVVWMSHSARAQVLDLKLVTADQLHEEIAVSGEKITVVNFWATWCGPCREEFPAFVQLGKNFDTKGVDVVFVSMDFDDEQPAVTSFLASQGVKGVSYLRMGDDNTFINAIHEDWSGVLPATIIYGSGGTLLDFWQADTISYDDLETRVVKLLSKSSSTG